jgi:hypothetical protein
MKLKIILTIILIIFPNIAFSKYLTISSSYKQVFGSFYNTGLDGSKGKKQKDITVELTELQKGYFNDKTKYVCLSSGQFIKMHTRTKKKIRENLGYFDCQDSIKNNKHTTHLMNGITYTYLSHPAYTREQKYEFKKYGLVSKKNWGKNPIIHLQFDFVVDKKTSYIFTVYKSETHPKAYREYFNVHYSVFKKRISGTGGEFYKKTKNKDLPISKITDPEVKKIYDALISVEKFYKKFGKKKFKSKQLDDSIKSFLTNLKPNKEWVFITQAQTY